jgi:hypothetical protein
MHLVAFEQDEIEHAGALFIEPGAIDGAWYRYDDSRWFDSRPSVHLRVFRVARETPKGVWLAEYGFEKFVLNDARKRFAYPTIELARESFLIRKRRQLGYLSSQHDHVAAVLKSAESHFKSPA